MLLRTVPGFSLKTMADNSFPITTGTTPERDVALAVTVNESADDRLL